MIALLMMFLMILIEKIKSKEKITGQTGNYGTKDVQVMAPSNS